MKKIMMVTPTLGVGGGERFVTDLSVALCEHGYEVVICVLFSELPTYYTEQLKKTGIKIVYCNKKVGLEWKIYKTLRVILNTEKPDVVHTNQNVLQYFLPFYFSNKYKKIHTVHSVANKEALGKLKYINQFLFKFCNVIPVAIGPTVKKTVEKFYGIEEIPEILNGIDLLKFKPKEHRMEDNGKTVKFIAVGTLYEVKNHAFMIQAFSEAYKIYPYIKLEIVGDGILKDELQGLINDYFMQNVITLVGIKNNIEKELQKADIYLMSSLYEGMPLSTMEALACGLPVISTKAGGVVDIVHNGTNGYLVDQNDKASYVRYIVELARDRNLREKIGRTAAENSCQYGIERCAKEYMQLYESK